MRQSSRRQYLYGTTTINAGATLALAPGGSIDSPAAVTDNGVLLNNGTINAASLTVNGALRGIGTVNAPTTVNGMVAPGNSPGTLTFTAPVTLGAGSTTEFEIDGTGTGTGANNYSRIVVTGTGNTIALAGTAAAAAARHRRRCDEHLYPTARPAVPGDHLRRAA